MTIRNATRECVTKVYEEHGIITKLGVDLGDGHMVMFGRMVEQPRPVETYIGKHEQLSGGYKHGRSTGSQSG